MFGIYYLILNSVIEELSSRCIEIPHFKAVISFLYLQWDSYNFFILIWIPDHLIQILISPFIDIYQFYRERFCDCWTRKEWFLIFWEILVFIVEEDVGWRLIHIVWRTCWTYIYVLSNNRAAVFRTTFFWNFAT